MKRLLFGISKKNSLEHHSVESCQRCGIKKEGFYNAYTGSGSVDKYYKKKHKKG